MDRRMTAWWALSAATIVLGFVVVGAAPGPGTIAVIAGVLGLAGFLLAVFRHATTHDDQWIWQTPGKRHREYRAEEAARRSRDAREATDDGSRTKGSTARHGDR